MRVRRVVTGVDSRGKSVVISDGPSPRERAMEHTPGFVSSPLWRSEGAPDLTEDATQDLIAAGGSMVLGEGGSSFWVITFPPDSVMMSPDWNPAVAGPEMAEGSPGIAERMEPNNPGMHRTPTVDYVTVIKGPVTLELDDGKSVELQSGDTVVQQGARHAWRNRTEEPVMVSVVLLGAKT
jgi:mannose-6-phosphate isomerase-like protein (cupin superfamily)